MRIAARIYTWSCTYICIEKCIFSTISSAGLIL